MKEKILSHKYFFSLGILLIIGLIMRFLYFPENIYFSYDQARDSFASLEILKGNFKIIGPPSSFNENLFHGPLVYYIYAPILAFFQQDPIGISIFLRIFNTLGILLTFLIASMIFDKKIGLIAAFLYAISFEQSQYSIFFGHPGLAVITVLLFYLGLSLLIFKKDWRGLVLSFLGLGLSIQFHYSHIVLLIPLTMILLIYFKKLPSISVKQILFFITVFIISTITFLISEIKYGFHLSQGIISIINTKGITGFTNSESLPFNRLGKIILRSIQDNFLPWQNFLIPQLLFFIIFLGVFLYSKKTRLKVLFLLIWFLGGLTTYLLTNSPSYYYNAGSTVSLLVFLGFLIDKMPKKYLGFGLVALVIFFLGNFNQIISLNSKGPNLDFVIQPGMLLSDEKEAIDYIYYQAKGKPFAVKALTVPLSINTTWSYLFEWYGQKSYGYLPIWAGPIASGFPGNIPIENARSKLPENQFLIIEPTIGIRQGIINQFMEEEGFFTKIISEKQFGKILVQSRIKY